MKPTSNLRLSFYLALVVFFGLPVVGNASEGETTKSLLDLYREGGPIMHVIALCSVATLALGTYCGIMYRRAKMMPINHIMPMLQYIAITY